MQASKGMAMKTGMRPSTHLAALRRPVLRTIRVASLNNGQVHAAAVATKEKVDWSALNKQLESKSALDILDEAFKLFGDEVGIAFSGAEDVALIEYASLTGRPFRVFSLDTGRLNPETYSLFEAVEKKYNIKIEYTFPDAKAVTDLVNAKGMFSFYADGHTECCRVRKVQPLRRKLKTLKAWVTGQRKDQSPGTRMDVPVVQVDPAFEGVEGGPGSLIKFNPLSNATSVEVWNFLRTMDVPVNSLHAQGYISIGCAPCTRPVLPNQLEREGRWWWEDAASKECGLHSGNIKAADGTETARVAERDLFLSPAVTALTQAQLQVLADGDREQHTLVVLYAPWCPFCQAMESSYEELASRFAGSHVKIAKFQADLDRPFSQTVGLKTFPTIVLMPKGRGGYIKYPSERRDADSLALWVRSLTGSA